MVDETFTSGEGYHTRKSSLVGAPTAIRHPLDVKYYNNNNNNNNNLRRSDLKPMVVRNGKREQFSISSGGFTRSRSAEAIYAIPTLNDQSSVTDDNSPASTTPLHHRERPYKVYALRQAVGGTRLAMWLTTQSLTSCDELRVRSERGKTS